MKYRYRLGIAYLLLVASFLCHAETDNSVVLDRDPHYNDIGFFDVHICNWPERPKFFKVLFSSEHFDSIKSMDIYTPEGKLLTALDKSKFMTLERKNKPNKRVYMLNIDVPDFATTGWYRIDVTTSDGKNYQAKDFVTLDRIQGASGMTPSGEESVSLPVTLNWKPVVGAHFYQAYIRDIWNGNLVFQSKLVDKPGITVPEGKLEPGGDYYWTVHARDSNEHILLGDFHMGSLSTKAYFSVDE
jgi:hypothetical protein